VEDPAQEDGQEVDARPLATPVDSTLMRSVLLLVLVATVACGPGAPPRERSAPVAAPVAETCAVRLPPRAGDPLPPLPAAGAGLSPARSTLVVNVEVPLAGVRQALEAKVPRRVAEERDHDLGMAGRLEYTVDRGPFTLRVENDVLVVESVLQGRAQACAKGRCYAGCAPEARATARVPLHLGADYKLRSEGVRIDVTRGCEVRALGGLVTVDVTPILRGALAGHAHNVQASIDRELPDLRPEAARLWDELGKPKPLPLGACVVLAPEEITQGVASGTPELARLRFGLLARPEVRMVCGAPSEPAPTSPPRPLPPLRDDRALPQLGDVHLAIVLAPDAARRALEGADAIDLGRGRARIRKASGDVGSGLLLDLAGEVCGEVGTSTSGVAWADPQSLHLTGAAPLAGDGERLAAAGLDGARLAKGIELVPIPLPIAVSALGAMLPELARGLSDDRVTITAAVESAQPETAGTRRGDIVAVAILRGAVTIRAK
jgi:Domain of unknown function (DUF4403)